jgi:hypothetical protein
MKWAVMSATAVWTAYLWGYWALPYYQDTGTLAGGDGLGTAINIAAFGLPPMMFLVAALSARAIYRRLFLVSRAG